MNQKAIGVFDSGLGGMTVVKQIIRLMPGEDIIYFGDTGRVPYGTKSNRTIQKYTAQDIRFLLSKNVKMIIAACGTASSVAAEQGDALDIPFTGVVEHAARQAARLTQSGKIGVLGTPATIRSDSYRKALLRLNPDLKIYQTDCPLFVSLVENGMISPADPIPSLVAQRYLAPILTFGVDTLILGCTHYPLLSPVISRVAGDHVHLVDAGAETAKYALTVLNEQGLCNESQNRGNYSFYVSDEVDNFTQFATLYLGMNIAPAVEKIDIESY